MKKTLIILWLFCSQLAFTQTLLSTAGELVQNASTIISYSIGEPIVQTAVNNQNIITQGFQQPKLKITTSNNDYFSDEDLIVYPNPTTSIVFFKNIEKIKKVEVYNDLGQLIFIENDFSKGIDFQNLSSQDYFLVIKMNDEKTLSRKVTKL